MGYGLYVHIPFCRSRCRYCDFYTQPGAKEVPDEYIDAILRDFKRYAPRDSKGRLEQPASVYFGGGTPSLLSPTQVERLMEAFRQGEGAEVTLEVNPESATKEKLAEWKKVGVNRLSIGVQSAREESLRRLGRLHTVQDAKNVLRTAVEVGFKNITGDIMLALPEYSKEEFEDTLSLLQAGGAEHISAYLLKIEKDTEFGCQLPAGLPTEDEAADFYLYAVQRLEEESYAQYEISNFARLGHEGRHNLIYWTGQPYLGIGPAAASCLLGRRFVFGRDTEAFIKGNLPPLEEGTYEAQDYIMLRLRLRAGISEEELYERFGVRLTEKQAVFFARLVKNGFAVRTKDGFALTPRGFLVQNTILAQLL